MRCKRAQADETWCFVGAKAENVTDKHVADGRGDVWTWTAIDGDTKLCVSYAVGGRDGWWATEFTKVVASRMHGRVQLTTDGHRPYLNAVDEAFGEDVEYAQLHKIYRASNEGQAR